MTTTATTTTDLPELMTSEEARVFLRIERTAFYGLLRNGKLPAVKVGRVWRFRRSSLTAWLEKQERKYQWAVD